MVGVYLQTVKGHYLADKLLLGVNVNSVLKSYLVNTETPYYLVLGGTIIATVLLIILLLFMIFAKGQGFAKFLLLNLLVMFEFAIGITLATIVNYYTAYTEIKSFVSDIIQTFGVSVPPGFNIEDYIMLSDSSLEMKKLVIADIVIIFAIVLPSLIFILYHLILDRD